MPRTYTAGQLVRVRGGSLEVIGTIEQTANPDTMPPIAGARGEELTRQAAAVLREWSIHQVLWISYTSGGIPAMCAALIDREGQARALNGDPLVIEPIVTH